MTRYTHGQWYQGHDDSKGHHQFQAFPIPYNGGSVPYSNRIFSCFVYLNDCAHGGTTSFHYLGATQFDSPSDSNLSIRPTQGMAVLFPTAYLPDAPAEGGEFHGILPGNKIWCMNHQADSAVDTKFICQQWGWSCSFKESGDFNSRKRAGQTKGATRGKGKGNGGKGKLSSSG